MTVMSKLSNLNLNPNNLLYTVGGCVGVVVLLVGLLDVKLRKRARQVRLLNANDEKDKDKPLVIPSVGDPIYSFLRMIYRAVFHKYSDYERFREMMKRDTKGLNTVTAQMFGKLVLLSWNQQLSTAVIKDKENWGKIQTKGFAKVFDDIAGDSVVSVEGEVWKHQRHILNPSFHLSHLQNLIPDFIRIADLLCDKIEIEARERSGKFEILKLMSKATIDALGKAGFGMNFNSLNDELTDVYCAYEEILRGIMHPLVLLPGFSSLPTETNKRFKRAVNVFQQWAQNAIEQKREMIQKQFAYLLGDDQNDLTIEDPDALNDVNNPLADLNSLQSSNNDNQSQFKPNVLDLMVAAAMRSETASASASASSPSSEERIFTDRELKHNVFLFFLAGHETTSGTLTFVIDFLSRYPDVQQKCRDEIISLFGSDPPSYSSLSKLKYLNHVINETMRLRGPVVGISREAKNDTELMGYYVPKGTFATLISTNLQIDPALWGDDADQFNPDRWAAGRPSQVSSFGYMPFGSGPRMCLGMNFANLEMRVLLVRLLQRFEFHAVDELRFIRGITVRPQDGYCVGVSVIKPQPALI